MNEIGGFPALEPFGYAEGRGCHTQPLVNLCRAGLALIAQARRYRRLWIPDYNCPTVESFLTRMGVDWAVYPVNDALEPDLPTLRAGDGVVYVNYFGIKGATCRRLEGLGLPLILDLSQAFFYTPQEGSDGVNSARKFVGVPDGGHVFGAGFSDVIAALPRQPYDFRDSEAQLLRLAGETAKGYEAFKSGDTRMESWPIARATALTESLLARIDWETVKRRRQANFLALHEMLGPGNTVPLGLTDDTTPLALCYPFRADWVTAETKRALIAKKIFVPTYWPNTRTNSWTEQTLFLPCDQRYTPEAMREVAEVVLRTKR